MAKTTAERMKNMRLRRKTQGLVRGEFYARLEHHKLIKAYAKELSLSLKANRKQPPSNNQTKE